MFIIRLLFYALEGFMGSSFLIHTTIDLGLTLYSSILCLKSFIQFGLPNHPARFLLYLVSLCAAAFFIMNTLMGMEIISPDEYLRLRAIPFVAGSLGMLLQIISTVGQFSLFQQKIISRIPLMGALLIFAFFHEKADLFMGLILLASVLFFSISVGKARYQKRTFFKMVLFLVVFNLGLKIPLFWVYVINHLFLFASLFYFFIFQQTFGISSIIEKYQIEKSGAH